MHNEYITTNIRISKDLWKSLKDKALKERKSLAQLFREGALCILVGAPTTKKEFKHDPFLKVIGLGRGTKHSAIEHDYDIYGNRDFC